MGRKTAPDGYLSRRDAAALLHVSLRHLDNLVKQRLLTPVLLTDVRTPVFHKPDVQSLAMTRSVKNGDLGQVRSLAMQALAATQVLERRVAEMYEFLGIAAEPLPRDAESIRALALELGRPIEDAQLLSPTWVKARAAQFFSMDQVYFELAGEVLGDDEPWKRYIDYVLDIKRGMLAHIELLRSLPNALVFAYKYLDGALQSLNAAGFLYCRTLYGHHTARQVFGTPRTAVEELELLLTGRSGRGTLSTRGPDPETPAPGR